MKGYVHSIQSLGTVDGPGVRAVVFTAGCPLRCIFCHNPDTWEYNEADLADSADIAERLLRFTPYIRGGGVTFSGGEPLLQAEFLYEISRRLKESGLHIALDTSGIGESPGRDKLISLTDLVLLDIKMTTDEDYKQYTGGDLSKVMEFLAELESLKKDVWIRHVVIPGINDTNEDIRRLCDLIRGFNSIKKVELLPFKTLCNEKYKRLGIDFPLKDTHSPSAAKMTELQEIVRCELGI